MNYKFGIIADDLTGANDSGVQLKEKGLETSVFFQIPDQDQKLDETIVIDTDSRALSKDQAYQTTKKSAQFLFETGYQHIYKKMDSTLRGYIGVELQAMKEVFAPTFLVVAPAFPPYGRTTEKGVHLLKGTPISETELAQDPKHPVKEARIASIIQKQTNEKVVEIDTQVLSGGTEAWQEKLKRLEQEGVHYLVCDARDQGDLKEIAEQINKYTDQVVWAGSAGLAEVLPDVLQISGEKVHKETIPYSQVLTVCGSLSQTTQGQIKYAVTQQDTQSVEVETEQIFRDEWDKYKQIYINSCVEAFNNQKSVVLYVPSTQEAREKVKALAKQMKMTPMEVGSRISQALGAITKEVIEQVSDLRALVLTGGDTAKYVAHCLGATGFRLTRQLEAGIPQGSLLGVETSIQVITKAGAFGEPASIYNAIQQLKGESENEQETNHRYHYG
ncbi:four-carbon acid sugar kinase family protein [Halobacillus shinanisalinarum]|uniref:Four-carbon acid sugar kinase family protein n=1 Tax=Halobacillus shinanisalinarum TaxID=2932258 RepID=A0ABY4H291_9BACI|nr:four-carbon acid sugar kinase family protein [Halobacillus shinanisalinarum]UOQ94553.1 four-carbon acid sugar kinase family protein [Halobacillus shinanisalinarum]